MSKIQKLEDYMLKTAEDREELMDSPNIPMLVDYFQQIYPLEYMLTSENSENWDIIISACAKYEYKYSKWLTSGGDISVAHEVAFKDATDHIDSATSNVIKK